MREIWIPGIRRVLRISLSARAVKRDVDEEIRFHLDARTAELKQLGMTEREARERAETEYGDVHGSERELVDVDRRRLGHEQREELVMSFIDDVRYAARGLMRRPALMVITTIALSIGIAANAIMFGVVDQLLLRPPAHVRDPKMLRRVFFEFHERGKTQLQSTTVYPVIAALRRGVPAADVVAFSRRERYTLGRGAGARAVDAQLVSGNFFQVLGVRPSLGRGFLPGDDRIPLGAPVAVVSDDFWKREMGEAADAVGRVLEVNGETFAVVGVAPEGFIGIDRIKVDVWVPISSMAPHTMRPDWHSAPNSWWLDAFARIHSGASPELVVGQATVAHRNEIKSWNEPWHDTTAVAVLGSIVGARAPDGLSADSKMSLWLMGVSVIVLLIACANVASLLIARTVQRRREIAVRLALGVSRARLLRMLLTESALLAAIGATVALGLAFGASRAVQRLLLPGIVWSDRVLDMRVLAFALVATVACIILAGIAPALQGIGTKVTEGLKASRQMTDDRSRLRYALLVFQAALSVVLLIGAGLFVKSLRNVTGRDVGIDLDRVMLTTMDLERFGFARSQQEDVFRRGLERLRSIPGVAGAAIVRQSVPSQSGSAVSIEVPGVEKRPKIPGGGPYSSVVGTEYFSTMGTAVLRGRTFTPDEERVPSRVLLVNRIVADAYWPGQDPVGKCARLGSDSVCSEVIGVVENAMLFSLIRDDRAMLYVSPTHAAFGSPPPAAFVIRSSGDPRPLVPLVRNELQALAPNMPFVAVQPFIDRVGWQLRPWRLGATMFTVFGIIALIIAAIGLYSVMAYWVSQRTHEIGVRMALGAQRSDVIRLVAWQSSRAVAIGLLVGMVAAVLASRWVADMLYETSPRDPLVYGAAALVLALAAIIASVVPARRSASVDPALAIRAE